MGKVIKGLNIVTHATLLLACTILLGGCKKNPEANSTQVSPANATDPDATARWGIEIVGVRRSAAGYILDFRYRVVDPEKSVPLLKRQVKPYLIDQKTRAKLLVPSSPKVGPLRQTSLEAIKGRVYFILFANPGGLVKAGDKVTVVIGDFQATDLAVE